MFKDLNIEDTRVTPNPKKAKDTSTSEGSTKTTATAEVELERSDEEIDFAIYCLFLDIYRILVETRKIWDRVKSRKLSIMHATLLIAAALDLVRRAEAEIMELWTSSNFAGDFAEKFRRGTYPAFLGRIYNPEKLEAHSMKRLKDKNAAERIIPLVPLDEFVLLPLAYTLVDFSFINSIRLNKDMPNSSFHFIAVPPSALDTVNSDGSVAPDDSQTLKARAEDKYLMETFHDMRFTQGIRDGLYDALIEVDEGAKPPFLPPHDILHNALRPVWEESTVSMTAVFAARLLVDMHDVCGLTGVSVQSEAAEIYVARSTHLVNTYYSSDMADFEWPTGDGFQSIIDQIRERIDCNFTSSPLWCELKTTAVEMVKGKKEAMDERAAELAKPLIVPNESDNFLMQANLLYGGSALLDSISLLEVAGIGIASQSFSIMCMAHVYNAVKQLHQLDMMWPEMDQAIKLQELALFANKIPTTRADMWNLFNYIVGLSITGNTIRPRDFKPTLASGVIGNYFDGKEDLSRLIYQLENEATQSEDSSKQSSHKKRGKGIQKSSTASAPESSPTAIDTTRHLAIQKLLHDLEKYFDTVLPVMSFDYIALTTTCSRMLSSLQKELVSHLGAKYNDDIQTRRVPGRVEVVRQMLHQNFQVSVAHGVAKQKAKKDGDRAAIHSLPEAAPVGPQLQHAAKFLRKFLVGKAVAART